MTISSSQGRTLDIRRGRRVGERLRLGTLWPSVWSMVFGPLSSGVATSTATSAPDLDTSTADWTTELVLHSIKGG
jgi:hypothetical protein